MQLQRNKELWVSLFSSYCFLANRDLGMLLAGQHLPTPLLSQYANVLGYSPVIPDYACACVHVKSLSCVQLPATLWAVACQALLSVGFSRQEYWSGLPFPPPGDLPNLGIEPSSLVSPALVGGFFTTSSTWEAQKGRDSPFT